MRKIQICVLIISSIFITTLSLSACADHNEKSTIKARTVSTHTQVLPAYTGLSGRQPITAVDSNYEDISGSTMDMFYVSPNGNDSNPGTKEKPLKTIAKAQSLVRNINKQMTGNIYFVENNNLYTLNLYTNVDVRSYTSDVDGPFVKRCNI